MILLPSESPHEWESKGLITDEALSLFGALDLTYSPTRSSRDRRTWTDKLIADRRGVDCWQWIYFSNVVKFEVEDEIMRLWGGKVCIKDAEHLALWYMCCRSLAHFGGPADAYDEEERKKCTVTHCVTISNG